MTLPAERLDVDPSFIQPTSGLLAADERTALRWYSRLALIVSSAVLLSLAFAPFGQFYLAWVAMVPWLAVLASASTPLRALAWGWLGGAIFFLISLSYVFPTTVAGAVALTAYMGLHWGVVALAISGLGLLRRFRGRPASIL